MREAEAQKTRRRREVCVEHMLYGEYIARFPKLKPEADPSCECGEPTQTVPHLLFHCPNTESSCHFLAKHSVDLNPTNLFGSPKGLKAITQFLEHSGIGHPG
ncbi:hypothetical protein RSAG8_13112, partial [Rhizoctonia solani AG-8 WAC10335]